MNMLVPQTVLALRGSGAFNLVPRMSKSWSLGALSAVIPGCLLSGWLPEPIKTNEILTLFGSKSRFAYKSNGKATFRPQI